MSKTYQQEIRYNVTSRIVLIILIFLTIVLLLASGWISEWTMGPPCDDHQQDGYWSQRCDGYQLADDIFDEPEVSDDAWMISFLLLSLFLVILLLNTENVYRRMTMLYSTESPKVWTRTSQSKRLHRLEK
ncbi:uncharacterized protein LOC117120884 [Anneissia japonica]|uniref:uncharacterized protein LOC117120884 n=1 Tax=Anneissia japonica TaxID=1529436 RepID=UPI001425A2BB|nr:uncharacterized protein LOC117120884 [Anneissia japonica]